MQDRKCYLCDSTASQLLTNKDGEIINCYHCGKYFISISLIESQDDFQRGKDNLYKVSSWVYEQNYDFNNMPELRTDNFEKLLEMRDKKVQEKFDLMMQCVYKSKYQTIDIKKCVIQSWFVDEEEFLLFFQKAIDDGFVKAEIQRFIDHTSRIQFQNITFDGLQYIENLESPNKSSKNVFLAFNFETELNDVFSTYVREAVETSGLNCIIVNQNNTEHDKSITDEIIGKLKSSRIVIADFTNHRNSVYFEAGFAMGMKIPIIWTVQKGHDNDMSFDTRQYPHIVWENGEDLKKQIMYRIKVIL
jgi:nucleoside 2-deoxyribosyltransferase